MNSETQKVLFSSKKSNKAGSSDNWWTPDDLYQKLNNEFNFTLDPAASHQNHKCSKYYTETENGLIQSWVEEHVFLNPPYSQIKDWMKKVVLEAEQNKTRIVLLVPARISEKWWWEYGLKANQIRFIKGRLKFYNPEKQKQHGAPFPSALIIFNSEVPLVLTDNIQIKWWDYKQDKYYEKRI